MFRTLHNFYFRDTGKRIRSYSLIFLTAWLYGNLRLLSGGSAQRVSYECIVITVVLCVVVPVFIALRGSHLNVSGREGSLKVVENSLRSDLQFAAYVTLTVCLSMSLMSFWKTPLGQSL